QIGRRILRVDYLGADENRQLGRGRGGVHWVVPRLREVDLLVERPLLQIRQDQRAPAVQRSAVRVHGVRGRQRLVVLYIVMQSQRDLLQVVRALGSTRSRPCTPVGR